MRSARREAKTERLSCVLSSIKEPPSDNSTQSLYIAHGHSANNARSRAAFHNNIVACAASRTPNISMPRSLFDVLWMDDGSLLFHFVSHDTTSDRRVICRHV